jgi:hypothetical protein
METELGNVHFGKDFPSLEFLIELTNQVVIEVILEPSRKK